MNGSLKKMLLTVGALALTAIGLMVGTASGGGDKVTICHAAGLEGTTKYVTLTISENAVYGRNGNAGHFEENGTPRAGHEQDYFGSCEGDETTPTDTTPTDTTPTTPTETTSTTPTTPSTPRCPPGMTPTAGKDGQPGNDECEFPKTETTPTAPTPPSAPAIASTLPTTTTAPPAPTTPVAKPPIVKPKPQVKPKPKAVAKPIAKKQPKLTGNPKVDKCKPMKGGTLNCQGTVVVPGSG